MDKRRNWIRVILDDGLNRGIFSPEDLVHYADPSVLATDLPPELVAALLRRGLQQGTFDAETLVEVLGTENMATHLPLNILWKCIAAAAKQIVSEHPLATPTHVANGDPIVPINTSVEPDEQPDIEVIDEQIIESR